MSGVLVEKSPAPGKLEVLGIEGWALGKLAPGEYTRTYDNAEECCIVEGEAVLRSASGAVEVAAGDLVFIPHGTEVTWEVAAGVEYRWRAGTAS